MIKIAIFCIVNFFLLQREKSVEGTKVRECGDPTWKAYKDEKCFKVLDVVMNKADGQAACSKETQYSFEDSLLTIKSEVEQDFIAEWLFDKEDRRQNLWLSSHRLEKTDEWLWDEDNTTIQYNNWAKGYNSSDGKNCAQISWEDEDETLDDPDTVGRWQSTSCSNKNLVVCQKPQVSYQWRAIGGVINSLKRESERSRKDSVRTKEKLVEAKKGLKEIKNENKQMKEHLKELFLENWRLNLELIKEQNVTRWEIDRINGKTDKLHENLTESWDTLGNLTIKQQFVENNLTETWDILGNLKLNQQTFDKNLTETFGNLKSKQDSVDKNLTETWGNLDNLTLKQQSIEKNLTETSDTVYDLKSKQQTVDKNLTETWGTLGNLTLKQQSVEKKLTETSDTLGNLKINQQSWDKNLTETWNFLGNLKTKQETVDKNLTETWANLAKLQGQVNTVDGLITLVNNNLLYPATSCDTIKPSFRSQKKQIIYPDGPKKPGVETLCDFETDRGGWTIIQRRSSGPKEEFYLGWNDYERGFGSLDKNYWIGLKNIYALTKDRNQELRVDMWDFEGGQAEAKYSNFSVSDSSDFYRLTISGFSGKFGDCLNGWHNGMRFSTKDVDNDLSEGNCAVRYKGAWWYNACYNSNLNGLYYEKGEKQDTGIVWYWWKSSHYSLRQVEMKIRKRR